MSRPLPVPTLSEALAGRPLSSAHPGALVVALGQRVAGDDGAGLAVLDELRRRVLPQDVELRSLAEASSLVPLLETRRLVIVVDAVVGPEPGAVLVLSPADLARGSAMSVSSHGIGVGQAVELARTLYGEALSSRIDIVGIAIAPPNRYAEGISPVIQAAVGSAVALVFRSLTGEKPWVPSSLAKPESRSRDA